MNRAAFAGIPATRRPTETTRVGRVSKQMTTSDPLVWIDCEMTGLDLSADALIEVAVVVTDYELKPLADGIDVLIKPSTAALEQMSDYVRNMHTSSGLLDDLESGLTMEEARETVLDYVTSLVPEARSAQLAGNSVGTDKAFLARDMPELIEHLHYRIVDVSSLRSWPSAGTPGPLPRSEEGRRPPRTGGHPGVHRRAALLPRGPVPRWRGAELSGVQGGRRARPVRADDRSQTPANSAEVT